MDKLTMDFESASKGIKKQLPMKMGGSAAEKNYSAAYQALVKAGLAPQIKKKYR